MYQRIYLVGYMGVGKSTIARKLSAQLNWDVLDLDHVFETRYKISIPDFFKRYDEALFRKLERSLLQETESFERTIISTGGGTPCYYDNMDWMNSNGLTVYLSMSAAGLTNRLIHAKKKRPVIIGKTEQNLRAFVKKHLQQRAIFYSQSAIHFEAESADIPALAALLKKNIAF